VGVGWYIGGLEGSVAVFFLGSMCFLFLFVR